MIAAFASVQRGLLEDPKHRKLLQLCNKLEGPATFKSLQDLIQETTALREEVM